MSAILSCSRGELEFQESVLQNPGVNLCLPQVRFPRILPVQKDRRAAMPCGFLLHREPDGFPVAGFRSGRQVFLHISTGYESCPGPAGDK